MNEFMGGLATLEHKLPESEAQKVAEFQECLRGLTIKPLTVDFDVNVLRPEENARQQFLGTDFQVEPTFYVVPEAAPIFGQLKGFEPLVSRGGKASGHGVFFGALILHDGSELSVAVKPHFVNEDDVASKRQAETDCLKDYFTNVAAKKCGFEGLEPVGFILNGESQPYSLTVLDESLTTLDSIDWTHFYDENFETSGMKELLHKVAMITAMVHDTGDSSHGDLEPRNIATNLYGHVFLIDWEYGSPTKACASDIEERFGHTWKDLKKIMLAMVKPPKGSNPGIGMFEQFEGDKWAEFKKVFLDDYLENRRTLAAQGSHHMKKVKETDAELTQLEYSLEMEMSRW